MWSDTIDTTVTFCDHLMGMLGWLMCTLQGTPETPEFFCFVKPISI